MNLITKYDTDKHFILDGQRLLVVQLLTVTGNGWGRVKLKNGSTQLVRLDRLEPYEPTVIDRIISEEEAKRKQVQEEKPYEEQTEEPSSPVMEKVEFKLRNPDGSLITKTLTGEDAQEWYDNIVNLCRHAENYRRNPEWAKLNWQIRKKKAQNG